MSLEGANDEGSSQDKQLRRTPRPKSRLTLYKPPPATTIPLQADSDQGSSRNTKQQHTVASTSRLPPFRITSLSVTPNKTDRQINSKPHATNIRHISSDKAHTISSNNKRSTFASLESHQPSSAPLSTTRSAGASLPGSTGIPRLKIFDTGTGTKRSVVADGIASRPKILDVRQCWAQILSGSSFIPMADKGLTPAIDRCLKPAMDKGSMMMKNQRWTSMTSGRLALMTDRRAIALSKQMDQERAQQRRHVLILDEVVRRQQGSRSSQGTNRALDQTFKQEERKAEIMSSLEHALRESQTSSSAFQGMVDRCLTKARRQYR
ncbi:hypothetical protein BGX33_005224 [Mortierella sp. NVP41]|nr:hypothetical protein BGX33_005224 [Mortierella sp. NVP41]